MTLLRSTGKVCYKISFNSSLSDVLLIIRLGKKCPEVVPFLSHEVRRCIIGDLNLHHLVKEVAARFLYGAVTVFLFDSIVML